MLLSFFIKVPLNKKFDIILKRAYYEKHMNTHKGTCQLSAFMSKKNIYDQWDGVCMSALDAAVRKCSSKSMFLKIS